MGYVGTLGRSVFALDLSKLRRWSALRRGVLVAATFAIGALVIDPEAGALASVASLFVGLQDRNASSSYTSRVMLVQSFLFAGVVLVGGVFSDVWVVPVIVLAGSAVVAGLAAEHDRAISRMFGDVMPVAAFLGLSTVENTEAMAWGLAVLLAGLAQALSARLSVRVEGDLIERRTVAAALTAVADHLDDALARQRSTTGRDAEERLLDCREALAASDESLVRIQALRAVLADAEVLRQEAGALRLRRAHGLPVVQEDEVAHALALASTALRASATILSTPPVAHLGDRKAHRAEAALSASDEAAARILALPRANPTAGALARETRRLSQDIQHVGSAGAGRSTVRSRRVGEGMGDYLRHPSRRDAVTGARLGLATVVSLAVAALLQVPHGAWVASTAVALLRPDRRALTADTLARALGTVAAAVLVLPLVLLTGGEPISSLLIVFLLSTATFVIAQANEGLYVLASAAQAVFTRAVVGEVPVDVAVARIEDVALGSAIALAFLLLLPITHGRRLARALAAYAETTATYAQAVGGQLAGRRPQGWSAMREEMRDARVQVQHGIDLRRIEPWGPGLSVERGSAAFAHLHEAARFTAAAERALRHGEPADADDAALAQQTARVLHATAETLRSRGKAMNAPFPAGEAPAAGDIVSVLLDDAAAQAQAALDAVTRTPANR